MGFQYSIAFGIIGLVCTIPSIPFCYFMSLTYFNPNPASKALLSRLNATMEIYEMTLRTIVAFLDVFLNSFPLARTAYLCLMSAWIAAYILRNFPYYKKSINRLRFILFMNLALGGLWGTLTYLIYGKKNYDDPDYLYSVDGGPMFYVWLGIFPILSVGSVFVFRKFYAKTVYAVYTAVSPFESASGSVMFYEEKINEMGIKFRSPYQVELAGRFIRDCVIEDDENDNGGDNKDSIPVSKIRIAKAIYNRGFAQFDSSPIMLAMYGTFLGVYAQDFPSWKSYLDKASLTHPDWLTGLVIAQCRSEHDNEVRKAKSGDAALDLVDLLEISNHISAANRRKNKIKEHTAEIWKLLLTGKVDAERVQRLIGKIYANEISVCSILEKIVLKYPRNYHALAAYASFLDVSF